MAGDKWPVVAIQPLGEVPAAVIDQVSAGVRQRYAVEVKVLAARPSPKAAYHAPRDRQLADRLLDDLEDRLPDGCSQVIGVTASDISVNNEAGKTAAFSAWAVMVAHHA